jgi:HIV Tat-specific factor 1
MFTIQELDEDPGLLFDLKEDILSEGSKLGEVLAVTVYDHMADGVCSVKFKEAEAAKKCIQV